MGCPGNQRIAGGGVLLTQGVVSTYFYSSNPPPNGGGFFFAADPTPVSFDDSSRESICIYGVDLNSGRRCISLTEVQVIAMKSQASDR